MGDAGHVAAEARARALIDAQLTAAGWSVQDRRDTNLFAAQGVAVREAVMAAGHGRADYLLYVDRRVVGALEAKPAGTTLSGVEWQSAMYATGLPADVRHRAVTTEGRLPFVLESSGTETHLTNGYDPAPRARLVSHPPQPATLARLVRDAEADPDRATWRAKVAHLPPLATEGLRPAQVTAIEGIERSLVEQRHDRSLVQMATGAGKTFTAITQVYRLLRHGGMRRVLFLVDRNNLADQTLAEFGNYRAPGDGRRFTEIYNVDKLTSAGALGSSSVVVSTIQRVYALLRGREVGVEDDPGTDDYVPARPVEAPYNAAVPAEAFDLVIVDEAHRSIYGVWRGVLDYFDAHVLGLTATPGKQTLGFFRRNLVSEYTYPQSVADGVNVDFDVYRIRTEITERGSTIEAGTTVPTVDRRTRERRYLELDEDLTYSAPQVDRAVTSLSQIRTVLETFRDRLFTEIFRGRSVLPKTLVFCKDDAHAEEVVTTARQVFGVGNDEIRKITYNARDPKGSLSDFRQTAAMRMAVTVDMIATGTDVRPLECLLFLRDVRSAQYFEQMKGRGARTIAPAEYQAVTPDALMKTRFVLVDAVGVTEHTFVEPPLNRDRSASLQELLDRAANLTLTEAETATLASRLSALDLQLSPAERAELDEVAGRPLREVVRGLVEAVDPDLQARARTGLDDEAADRAVSDLLDRASEPLARNPVLRQRILELRRAKDRVVDEVSEDVLLDAAGVVDTERARAVVQSWTEFLHEHRDEIGALQVREQARDRHLRFGDIQELADRIRRPPHGWTPDLLWRAYEVVEGGRVRRSDHRRMTDLVSLLRFTLGQDDELVPYADRVAERYAAWLRQQEQAGVRFTDDERWWLDHMAEVIASSVGITPEDLDTAPFTERGGVDGLVRDLGTERSVTLFDTLNRELTA